jgi:hypothetical protein
VMYSACEPCEKRMRRSEDGGDTWTQPEAFLPSRGDSGPVTYAVDGNNVLHALWGDRAQGFSLWHRSTSSPSGPWSAPDPVVPLGERERHADNPATAFESYNPRAVVSQGNVLLVSWRLDPGAGGNGTWYSFTSLDTAELPFIAVPTILPEANPVGPENLFVDYLEDEVVATPRPQTVDPTVQSSLTELTSEPDMGNRPATQLLAGLFSAILFTSVVIASRLIRAHS